MADFPTLSGVDIAVKRTTLNATKVKTSESGKETRARLQSTPRYQWEIDLNHVREAGPLGNELVTLLAFIDSVAFGRWGTFNFTDPVDGLSRNCRLDTDELQVERIAFGVWKVSGLKIISLK